jgi:hypothetical protein
VRALVQRGLFWLGWLGGRRADAREQSQGQSQRAHASQKRTATSSLTPSKAG